MKNFLLLTIALTLSILTACGQDKAISENELPADIRTYINDHFANNKIIKAELDVDNNKSKYEVKLDNNIELDFNADGKITDIESKNELPSSVIPEKIFDYVKLNYPNNVITDWQLDNNHQEVALDNGLELEFTMDGVFIKMD